MKKAVTLCMAAVLTISASATAYAAPCSIQSLLKGSGKCNSIICDDEVLKEALKDRLEACLPNISFPTLPDIESKPETGKPEINRPETNKPETNKPEADTSVSAYAAKVVELVNKERAKVGLPALKLDAKASQAAQVRAKEVNSVFSHTRPDGRSCFTALKEAGVSYRTAGENIAKGQRTPEEVVNAWMNSAGHRANILGKQFTAIGVGYSTSGNGWAQFFIG